MAAKTRKAHRHFRRSKGRGEHDYLVVATGIFFVVAIAHFLRAFYGLELIVVGWDVPAWASWFAVALAGLMAWRGWQYSRR